MEAVQRLGGGGDPGRQRVRLESYCHYMSRYFAFVALVAVLVLIPGPAVILVMQKAVTSGYRGALRVAAGVLAADLVWAAAAAAGVSAVIVASEPAFLALRFAGAAYLIYLGARLLLTPGDKLLPAAPARDQDETPARAGRARGFRRGFLCDMTNPKTLLVFHQRDAPVHPGWVLAFGAGAARGDVRWAWIRVPTPRCGDAAG